MSKNNDMNDMMEMFEAGLKASEMAIEVMEQAKKRRSWAMATASIMIEAIAQVTGELPMDLAKEIAEAAERKYMGGDE